MRLTVTKGQLLPEQRLRIAFPQNGWPRIVPTSKLPGRVKLWVTVAPNLFTFCPETPSGNRSSASELRWFVCSTGCDSYRTSDTTIFVEEEPAGSVDGPEPTPSETSFGSPENYPRLFSAFTMIQDGPYQQEWPVHEHCELTCIVGGEAVMLAGTQSLTVQPGSVVLVKSYQPHSTLIQQGKFVKGIVLCFSSGSLTTHIERLDQAAMAASGREESARIFEFAEQSLRETQGLMVATQNAADAWLHLLLTESIRLFSPAGATPGDNSRDAGVSTQRILRDCIAYIKENFAEDLSLDHLAREIAVSRYHLSHVFSRFTGYTVSAFITSVRMEQAGSLVASTTDPLKQIAATTGYHDVHYFSKVFRKHYGMPPGKYRELHAPSENSVPLIDLPQ